MIDLDRMEDELFRAVDRAPVPTLPAPAPVPPAGRRRTSPAAPVMMPGLHDVASLAQAEARMAGASRIDALTWATMRALLDGRRVDTAVGVRELLDRARAGDDPAASTRYWAQRFWAAVEWGTAEERQDVLDHCRDRAYRFDDVSWWGNLTLLLAVMGKGEEAARAFDDTLGLTAVGRAQDATALDVVTNLVEAGATLGDGARVAAAGRLLLMAEGGLLVVTDGAVCKGSVERYVALTQAALGQWTKAAESFRAAEAAHRAIGAGPLLARTLQQATGALVAA